MTTTAFPRPPHRAVRSARAPRPPRLGHGLAQIVARHSSIERAALDAWFSGDRVAMTSAVDEAASWFDALVGALVPRERARLSPVPSPLFVMSALAFARTAAALVYLRGWLAYHGAAGGDVSREPPAPRPNLAALLERPFKRAFAARVRSKNAMSLGQACALHRRDLARLHRASLAGDPVAILKAGRDAWGRLDAELAGLARVRAGGDAERVRFAWWLRRRAMVVGASLVLAARLRDRRDVAELQRAAKRRALMARDVWSFERATRRADRGLEHGLVGTVAELVLDGAEGGAARRRAHARLANGQRVEVPYKHLATQGVTVGAAVWLRGKLSHDVFEVEQEGLTASARTVWEDYLAGLVRPAFDLAPGAIFGDWELPAPDAMRRVTDLVVRIGGAAGPRRTP